MRLLVLLLVIAAFVGIAAYSSRTEVINLPNDRAWAQGEVQKLRLSDEEKKSYLADIQSAPSPKDVQAVVWKARWFGDPAYRTQKTQEKAVEQADLDRTEPIRRWALLIGGPLFFAFAFFFARRQMVH